jgi:hypothetical protein
MALKFARRRSSNLAPRKRRIIVQRYNAIDHFGDLSARKKAAAAAARKLGHDMRSWVRRSNDPAGRWNSFCVTCNKLAVVCTEAPEGFEEMYGTALKEGCLTSGS